MERDEAVRLVQDWPISKGAKAIMTHRLSHGDADEVAGIAGHLKPIGRMLGKAHHVHAYDSALPNGQVACLLRRYLEMTELYPEVLDLLDCWAIAIAGMSRGYKTEDVIGFVSQGIRCRKKKK